VSEMLAPRTPLVCLASLVCACMPGLMLGPVLLLASGCSDPVSDQLVQSLGPEDPNVPRGPNHRPGQPCLACHGGSGPAVLTLTIGGTVYAQQDKPLPAVAAQVQIVDQSGHTANLTTNPAGNFFTTAATFQPVYPFRVAQVAGADGTKVNMFSVSNREGSCAMCHFSPASPISPGPVFVLSTTAAALRAQQQGGMP
jgi:hypothetical protein